MRQYKLCIQNDNNNNNNNNNNKMKKKVDKNHKRGKEALVGE